MATRYIKKAMHCIGLGHRKPYIRHGKKFYRPYRNYYATGGPDEDWELMVQVGYARQGETSERYKGRIYWLTREGLDWLGEKLGMRIYDEEE